MPRKRMAAFAGCAVLILAIASGPTVAQDALLDRLDTALLDRDTEALLEIIAAQDDPAQIAVGRTPLLHHAVLTGDETMVTALLDAGLDIDVQGPDGDTALTLATELGESGIIDLLLERNADRTLLSSGGLTAAEIAARRGEDVLRFRLLSVAERRTHVNAWLLDGAARGDKRAMSLAVSAGAAFDATTPVGDSLIQVALAHQEWPVIEYIRDLPAATRKSVLKEKDVHDLVNFALINPSGSAERAFASRTISAFVNANILDSRLLRAALSPPNGEADTDTVREALRQIGLSPSRIGRLFPEPSHAPPRLEYKLRMDAPPGGIKPLHWKRVQSILKEEGLYDGAIDGIAKGGTYDAVYAYIIGIAPLVVERARYAHELARRETMNRFGVSEVLLFYNSKEYFLSGERIRVGYGSEAVGYTVFSENPDIHLITGYRYDAIPVPPIIQRGWKGQNISVLLCTDGLARQVGADLLGASFVVYLGEKPQYSHNLTGSDAFKKRLVGQLPEIECE